MLKVIEIRLKRLDACEGAVRCRHRHVLRRLQDYLEEAPGIIGYTSGRRGEVRFAAATPEGLSQVLKELHDELCRSLRPRLRSCQPGRGAIAF